MPPIQSTITHQVPVRGLSLKKSSATTYTKDESSYNPSQDEPERNSCADTDSYILDQEVKKDLKVSKYQSIFLI